MVRFCHIRPKKKKGKKNPIHIDTNPKALFMTLFLTHNMFKYFYGFFFCVKNGLEWLKTQ